MNQDQKASIPLGLTNEQLFSIATNISAPSTYGYYLKDQPDVKDITGIWTPSKYTSSGALDLFKKRPFETIVVPGQPGQTTVLSKRTEKTLISALAAYEAEYLNDPRIVAQNATAAAHLMKIMWEEHKKEELEGLTGISKEQATHFLQLSREEFLTIGTALSEEEQGILPGYVTPLMFDLSFEYVMRDFRELFTVELAFIDEHDKGALANVLANLEGLSGLALPQKEKALIPPTLLKYLIPTHPSNRALMDRNNESYDALRKTGYAEFKEYTNPKTKEDIKTVISLLGADNTPLSANPSIAELDPFDLYVVLVCNSIADCALGQGKELVVPLNELCRLVYGQGHESTQERKSELKSRLEQYNGIQSYMHWHQALKNYETSTSEMLDQMERSGLPRELPSEGPLLPTAIVLREINGVMTECVRIYPSPLLAYTRCTKRFARAPRELLTIDTPRKEGERMRNSDKLSITKTYLIEKIATFSRMKQRSFAIRTDWFYKQAEATTDKKKRTARTQCEQCLNTWVKKGVVEKWHWVKEGPRIVSVKITLTRNGLNAIKEEINT